MNEECWGTLHPIHLQLFYVWETIKTCVGSLSRLNCHAKVMLLEQGFETRTFLNLDRHEGISR